jgi:iron complex outermembrane receptor protein
VATGAARPAFSSCIRMKQAGRCLRVLVAAGVFVCSGDFARAEQPSIAGLPPGKELIDLDLEQLSNIVVTSVSLREQPLSGAPASIYVITNEDIRRSGVTNLPEALRLAPNLQVARADAAQYAISARGFYSANVLINKLLVLIDGRTVYSPLFSGVFWEVQQVMLEDVDRIEVISGAGSTEWGANAVNGIINVITKRARDTQGTLVSAGAGNRENVASIRHGGTIGDRGHYRIYGTRNQRNNSWLPNGTPLRDGLESGQAGFRADWNSTAASAFTLQGDVYRNDIEQAVGGSRDLAGANLIGRWEARFADQSRMHVQLYYDRVERDQPGAIREKLDTMDFEFNHGFRMGERHRLLWGAGYRYMHDEIQNLTPVLRFLPDTRDLHRANVFVQDTYALTSQADIIAGIKFEHNDYTGWEVLPSLRLAWRLEGNRLLWAAASRAVRTPARIDRELFVTAPPPIGLSGNSSFKSETVNVYEIGYRAQPSPTFSYSINAFHHDFDRLRTTDLRGVTTVFENYLNSRLDGISGWGSWRVMPAWRLTAGAVKMRQRFTLDPGNASIGGVNTASPNDPSYWWHFSSSFNITPRHEFDIRVRHVGESQGGNIPDYTAVDARLGWKASRNVELSITAQNLFDPGHQEWGTSGVLPEVRRAWFAKLLWRM